MSEASEKAIAEAARLGVARMQKREALEVMREALKTIGVPRVDSMTDAGIIQCSRVAVERGPDAAKLAANMNLLSYLLKRIDTDGEADKPV